jgi:hypothetical protein
MMKRVSCSYYGNRSSRRLFLQVSSLLLLHGFPQ